MRVHRSGMGYTLVEIMIVIGIISIVAMIAVPTWLRQREVARGRACQENLMKIDEAKELFALEGRLSNGTTVSMADLIRPNHRGYLKDEPQCPASGIYIVNPIGIDPACSYYGNEDPKTVDHKI
jgi:prepilin-type N-terminal cleavage/methylation domain-containing protein